MTASRWPSAADCDLPLCPSGDGLSDIHIEYFPFLGLALRSLRETRWGDLPRGGKWDSIQIWSLSYVSPWPKVTHWPLGSYNQGHCAFEPFQCSSGSAGPEGRSSHIRAGPHAVSRAWVQALASPWDPQCEMEYGKGSWWADLPFPALKPPGSFQGTRNQKVHSVSVCRAGWIQDLINLILVKETWLILAQNQCVLVKSIGSRTKVCACLLSLTGLELLL